MGVSGHPCMTPQKTMKQTLQTEPPKLKLDLKEDGLTFLTIALVCLIQGVAISGFYVPHSFLGGGVTGISMLVNYITGLPTWPFIILLNIPILLIGCKYLRIKSVLFSLVATLLLSVAMGFTSGLDFGVKDPLVSAAAGTAKGQFLSENPGYCQPSGSFRASKISMGPIRRRWENSV